MSNRLQKLGYGALRLGQVIKRNAPWIPVVLACATVFLAINWTVRGAVPQWAILYLPDKGPDLIGSMMGLAGLMLTFGGLLFAGREALRGLTLNAVLDLINEEASPAQGEAKQLVWKAKPPTDDAINPYRYVREYVGNSGEDAQKLDEARRRLSYLWYRAARLHALGVLSPSEIIETVGPPDIVAVLERLEAIKAESINPNWKPRAWPPMTLYIAWQKQQGDRVDMRQVRAQVPARPDLYEQSKLAAASSTAESLQSSEGAHV